MNKDLAPICTTIRKIRQHDTVQALRRASMTASLRASARHPSIVLRIHQRWSPLQLMVLFVDIHGYTSWFSRGRAGSWLHMNARAARLDADPRYPPWRSQGWAERSLQDTVTSGWRSSAIKSYSKNSQQITNSWCFHWKKLRSEISILANISSYKSLVSTSHIWFPFPRIDGCITHSPNCPITTAGYNVIFPTHSWLNSSSSSHSPTFLFAV